MDNLKIGKELVSIFFLKNNPHFRQIRFGLLSCYQKYEGGYKSTDSFKILLETLLFHNKSPRLRASGFNYVRPLSLFDSDCNQTKSQSYDYFSVHGS